MNNNDYTCTGRRDPVVSTPHHAPNSHHNSYSSRQDPIVPMPSSPPINYNENSQRESYRNREIYRNRDCNRNRDWRPSYSYHREPCYPRPSSSSFYYGSRYHTYIPYHFRPVHLVALPILFPVVFAAAIVPEFLPLAFLLTVMAAGIGTIAFLALKILRNNH